MNDNRFLVYAVYFAYTATLVDRKGRVSQWGLYIRIVVTFMVPCM